MALDRLMRQPPKRDEVEYRGRPGLVDVTRTIDILREERAQERLRSEGARVTAELNELQRQKDAGETEFFGLADVFRGFEQKGGKLETAIKPMPNVRTVFADIDPGKNAEALAKQKAEIMARQERARASAGDKD